MPTVAQRPVVPFVRTSVAPAHADDLAALIDGEIAVSAASDRANVISVDPESFKLPSWGPLSPSESFARMFAAGELSSNLRIDRDGFYLFTRPKIMSANDIFTWDLMVREANAAGETLSHS
jgi:hypothetical protein